MLQAAARARAGHAQNRTSNHSSANSSAHISRAPSPITINSDSDDDIVILLHTLANAVAGKTQLDVEIQDMDMVDSEDSNDEQCNWNGETTHHIGYHTNSDWEMVSDSGNDDGGEESDEDIEELEGDELITSLERAISTVGICTVPIFMKLWDGSYGYCNCTVWRFGIWKKYGYSTGSLNIGTSA